MRSRCCILLLMSQGVQFDIYVKPADANEKNESTSTSNLICAYNWTASLKTHRFNTEFLSKCVCTSQNLK